MVNSRTTFVRAEPQLLSRDIESSIAFYTERLGFAVAFVYGSPASYAQVYRDAAHLNIRHVHRPVFDATVAEDEQILTATIALDDAEPLFREYEARGVAFAQPLRVEEWGAKTFIVRDPDGNAILFAGRA